MVKLALDLTEKSDKTRIHSRCPPEVVMATDARISPWATSARATLPTTRHEEEDRRSRKTQTMWVSTNDEEQQEGEIRIWTSCHARADIGYIFDDAG